MDDNLKTVELLFAKAVEFGKLNLKLFKLKVLDISTEVLSSIISNSVVIFLGIFFLLFLSIGSAIWMGQILGEIYLGFFVLAGFYCIVAVVYKLFISKWIKRIISNYVIKTTQK
jgi:hypothetical protein